MMRGRRAGLFRRGEKEGPSVEDDGSVFIGQQAMVKVPIDGAGEHDFFEIAAEADEIVHALAVGDPDDVLLDDGAFVELLCDVVGRGADDFDAAVVGGLIGACAGIGGEKGLVDIDDASGKRLDKGGAEDLHVAGENDKVDAGVLEKGDLAGFCFGLVGGGDGDVWKGSPWRSASSRWSSWLERTRAMSTGHSPLS